MSHPRLQLAVGAAALVGEELPATGEVRRFLARGPSDPLAGPATRLLLVHPPPPDGPADGTMLERMAAVRAIRHDALVAPLATGQCDGGTWVVEPLPTEPTLAERLATSGPLSVQETIRILRETSRALSALHRAGLGHGALDSRAIECAPGAVAVHRLGHRDGGDPAADLHALGRLGWLALTGREATADDRSPRTRRDTVPESLDRLIAALLDPDTAVRPASAEVVLERLDWFPAQESTPLATLIDGAGRGSRQPRERRAGVALAMVGLALLLFWLFTRGG